MKITPEQAAELVRMWKEGAGLTALAEAASTMAGHPVPRGTARSWVITALGGPQAYAAANAAREAPQRATPTAPTPPSDTDVPVVPGLPKAKGWGTEPITLRGRTEKVFVSPTGERYVIAGGAERADLLVEMRKTRHGDLGALRLRLLDSSGKVKREHKQRRQIEKHEARRVVRRRQQLSVRRKGKDQ